MYSLCDIYCQLNKKEILYYFKLNILFTAVCISFNDLTENIIRKTHFSLGFDKKELPLRWIIFILFAYIKPFYTWVNSNKHINCRSYLFFGSKGH